MENLKPCPFCGGRPHFEKYWSGRIGFTHTCRGGSGNDRRIAIYANGFEANKDAIEAWNRRAGDTNGE